VGNVQVDHAGGNTIVNLNTDADPAIEFQVTLTGNITLVAGDFIFH